MPNSLEMSNVDLAEELVSMMITKTSFKANIKMIQAGDEMIGNLLDIKT
jgi:flagellar hook protein FlgE